MITPSKSVTIPESALGQATAILEAESHPRDLIALYHALGEKFGSIDDFILALDLLFVLGRVDIDVPMRLLTYAD